MDAKLKKIWICLFLSLFAVFTVFSQAAVNRAAELINKNIIVGNTEKAYSYALFIIKFYNGEEIPYEYETAVKKAVVSQAESYVKAENWEMLLELEKEVAPGGKEVRAAAAPYVKKARDYFEQIEKEKELKKKQEDALVEKIRQTEKTLEEEQEVSVGGENAVSGTSGVSSGGISAAELEKLLQAFESSRKAELEQQARESARLEQIRLEQEKKIAENDERRHAEMTELIRTMNENSENVKNTAAAEKDFNRVFVLVLIVTVAVVISILIVFFSRQQKIQSEQLKTTVQTMQAMRAQSVPAIPVSPSLLSATTSDAGAESQDVINLIETCRKYGSQIDSATQRRNVTTQVAELVVKICTEMGCSRKDILLNYAAALVYDIGFLSIDTSILRAEVLSKDQFEILKTHTSNAEKMIFFVDEKYRPLFRDAVSKHHENMDGSGYPFGLKGKDIPFIARVLRVAESYVALISSRNYREIMDRNMAVSELENSSNLYDPDIVQALIAVV